MKVFPFALITFAIAFQWAGAEVVLPTSEDGPQNWRYSFEEPPANWSNPNFDHSEWKEGPGGFGTEKTPRTHVRTEWNGSDIWIRRSFQVKALPKGKQSLRIYHDEDAVVFLNGVKIADLAGGSGNYKNTPLDASALKVGRNVLAIHCRQTRGGQYIDAGIVSESTTPKSVRPLVYEEATWTGTWKPVKVPLDTPWTSKVDPENPLPEHPRPDFERESWMSLNGLWEYALEPVDFEYMQGFIDRATMTTGDAPSDWDGKVLVPFAIDSPLSGIMHVLRPEERIWYQRDFDLPVDWDGKSVLIHFEASDWETSLYVNGERVGQHRGGYDPFHFDISDTLKPGANTVQVCVWDGNDFHCQPLGKQIMPEFRHGFRYQPTGGIWQTVWLEAVPKTRIASVKITPSLTGAEVVPVFEGNTEGLEFAVSAEGGAEISGAAGPLTLEIENPKLWSPKSPHLYGLTFSLSKGGEVIDEVKGYVGLRTFEKGDDDKLLLNGEPAPVQWGPLDQGYWPDGILTPPHEDAIKFDLEYLKEIGCNMVRVHIKVHPRRWYYHADRLGLLVWQDMVCTPKFRQTVDEAASENWIREFNEMITDFHNHPSIVKWVVFNEAWGQHDTVAKTAWAEETDPSRVILSASGWTDHGVGDVLDVHNYKFYISGPAEDGFGNSRALVFGELGGQNFLLPGKKWYEDQKQPVGPSVERAGGRMNYNSLEDMEFKYPFYVGALRHFVARDGYQGFVYTQITDVEHECNGWLTYDRRISKLSEETFRAIHEELDNPVTYTLLAGEGDWTAGRVAPLRKGNETPQPWTTPETKKPNFKPIAIPHEGGPIAPAKAKGSALALRHEFTLSSQPERAVLELRGTHANAFGDPPAPKLDGHRTRAGEEVPYVTYLDGKLHRRGTLFVERGQGGSVAYLELSPPEVASLTPGNHTLAIELPAPEKTVAFDAKLWSYEVADE
ncbi:MAG: sugar-binding domain-containing protein [Verrucomicrobiota bacterium]